jgi:hypothetical protein
MIVAYFSLTLGVCCVLYYFIKWCLRLGTRAFSGLELVGKTTGILRYSTVHDQPIQSIHRLSAAAMITTPF